MGEIAEMILNGDLDAITGEYLGNGKGYSNNNHKGRKSEDLSWRKVTGYLNNLKIKNHIHPELFKKYGEVISFPYSGKRPLRNMCFEIVKNKQTFENFKKWVIFSNFIGTN